MNHFMAEDNTKNFLPGDNVKGIFVNINSLKQYVCFIRALRLL